jgi:uncharacterized protein YlaI
MKVTSVKRWHQNQLKYYRKLKTSVISRKFRKVKKDHRKGKYALVLNSGKCAAILKFTSQTQCEVEAVVTAESIKMLILSTSKKFIISQRKKNLSIEVIVTKRVKDQFDALHDTVDASPKATDEQNRNLASNHMPNKAVNVITPIKIFSCPECNHKFTNKTKFDEHSHSHKDSESSGSEGELTIDDDVMLVLDPENGFTEDANSSAENPKTLMIVKDSEASKSINDDRPFHCNKCPEKFKRESALISHQRMSHPVEIVEAGPLPTIVNRRPSTAAKSQQKISFKRFDSSKKNKFSCSICSVSLERRLFLDRHINVYHIAKTYQCYKCHARCSSKMMLLDHLKKIHISLLNETGYIESISNIESSALFRCAFCRYLSKDRKLTENHMMNEHYEKYEKSEEDEVDDGPSSPDSLEHLFVSHQFSKTNEEEEENLLEEVQVKKISKPWKFKIRKPANDPSFKFRCARCQKRFSQAKTLKRHICDRQDKNEIIKPIVVSSRLTAKSQMINGFFNCLKCPKIYTDKVMFDLHVQSAHDDV